MIILVGESGSGKTTAEKELENKGFKRIVSYTTRPMREGEVDGVHYHFVTKGFFLHAIEGGFFAEHATYNDNYYGTAKEDCVDDSVIIVEPQGLQQLQEHPDLKTTSFYLKATELTRFQRMTISRNDSQEYALKRILEDQKVFSGIEKEVDYVVNSNKPVEEVVSDILAIVRW